MQFLIDKYYDYKLPVNLNVGNDDIAVAFEALPQSVTKIWSSIKPYNELETKHHHSTLHTLRTMQYIFCVWSSTQGEF